MKLAVVQDAMKSPAGIEVTRKFRDIVVTDIRNKLLAGVFANNPDDLEVSGEAKADSIVITARDLRTKKEAAKSFLVSEIPSVYAGEPEASDDQQSRRVPEDSFFGKVSEETFMKKMSEEQFTDRRVEGIKSTIRDKIQDVAKEFLTAFYSAKAGA